MPISCFWNLQVSERGLMSLDSMPQICQTYPELRLLRNACCHHSRVWNKLSSIIPVYPRRVEYPWISQTANPQKVYYTICIIKYFLNSISPNNDMLNKINCLFNSFPNTNKSALGFTDGWEQEPLWQ